MTLPPRATVAQGVEADQAVGAGGIGVCLPRLTTAADGGLAVALRAAGAPLRIAKEAAWVSAHAAAPSHG
jgi:hypothetical protein